MTASARKPQALPKFYYGEDVGDDEYMLFPLNATVFNLPKDGRVDLRQQGRPVEGVSEGLYFLTRDEQVLILGHGDVLTAAKPEDARKCLLYYDKEEAKLFFDNIEQPA